MREFRTFVCAARSHVAAASIWGRDAIHAGRLRYTSISRPLISTAKSGPLGKFLVRVSKQDACESGCRIADTPSHILLRNEYLPGCDKECCDQRSDDKAIEPDERNAANGRNQDDIVWKLRFLSYQRRSQEIIHQSNH